MGEEDNESKSKPRRQRVGAKTMQFDAVKDAAEFLDALEDAADEYEDEGADPLVVKPPPLPGGAAAVTTGDAASKPPMRTELPADIYPQQKKTGAGTYVMIAVVGLAMAGLGIFVGNMLITEDPPPAEADAEGAENEDEDEDEVEMEMNLDHIEVIPHDEIETLPDLEDLAPGDESDDADDPDDSDEAAE